MHFSRLPRFERASVIPAMQLTKRDQEVLRLVHDHRFLRSPQICALVTGSTQQILRRLKLLFHHGYLERPRAQLQYYKEGGSEHIVYALGKKGVAVLKELGFASDQTIWSVKRRGPGRVFLEHALLVSDVMVAIELACRQNGIRLVPHNELATANKARGRFQWRVVAIGALQLSVTPDRVFALEFKRQNGEIERAVFFLEADRATMPIVRKNFSQTSFYRKLLAYEAIWSQSMHRRRFGFHRFRVLTVTTSTTRRDAMVDLCSKLKSGHGLFLFADQSILKKPADILRATWNTSRKGETTCLLSN